MNQKEAEEAEFAVIERKEAPISTPSVFPGAGMLTPEMITKAEAAVDAVKKVRGIAFKVTNRSDWTRMGFGDKAVGYLEKSGCEKVGNLFGVQFSDIAIAVEDAVNDGVPVRTYTAKVTAHFNGRSYPQIGSVDSEFDFYKKGGKDEEGNSIVIPFGERDFTSMRKHALTNALNRALKAILGIDGIPWSEVEAALGKQEAEKVASINYDGGGTKAPTTAPTAGETDVRQKLWSMCMDMASQDEDEARRVCKQHSAFQGKDGIVSFDDPRIPKLSDKWVRSTYGRVKKEWEAAGLGGPREPGQEG